MIYEFIPFALQNARVHILDTETFENTFGPKSHRKRPNIAAGNMEVCIAVLTSN